jgi:hypothetical protein
MICNSDSYYTPLITQAQTLDSMDHTFTSPQKYAANNYKRLTVDIWTIRFPGCGLYARSRNPALILARSIILNHAMKYFQSHY